MTLTATPKGDGLPTMTQAGPAKPQDTTALIQILRDRPARVDERDDAAIDLGRSDDP